MNTMTMRASLGMAIFGLIGFSGCGFSGHAYSEPCLMASSTTYGIATPCATSISKTHGLPGEGISIQGRGLSGGLVWVQFGNRRVASKGASNHLVNFRVPDLCPGWYTVTVWVDGKRASGSFSFRVRG